MFFDGWEREIGHEKWFKKERRNRCGFGPPLWLWLEYIHSHTHTHTYKYVSTKHSVAQ